MRSDTEIDKIALAIEGDFFVLRNFTDVLGFIDLADAAEKSDSRVALPHLARDLFVAAHDLAHPRLDRLEVLRGERHGAGEIVIKAGLGGGPKRHLSFGIKPLDGFRHYMGCIMAQDLQPIATFPGN